MSFRTFVMIAAAACALGGCIGAPSPLAPGVHGSIGVPHRGCLTGGEALANKGDGFERFRKHEVRWGNPRLIHAIRAASAAVAKARPGGAPLLVGDISHEHGGEAEGHRSHRNGRDADLILYALTPDGRPVRPPGFINYGPDGLAVHEGKFYRLDVERTWLLARTLITTAGADVQWLFVAAWLEALLVEHARARGEPDEVVHKAESVFLQPADSTPHADHIHIRIACTQDELVAGCAGGGPRWRWLLPMPQLAPLSDQELIASIVGDLLPPGATLAAGPVAAGAAAGSAAAGAGSAAASAGLAGTGAGAASGGAASAGLVAGPALLPATTVGGPAPGPALTGAAATSGAPAASAPSAVAPTSGPPAAEHDGALE